MRSKPVYDPDFLNCSPELKKLLTGGASTLTGRCIDVPSGIGRNTFFLATRFDSVLSIDINRNYLNILKESSADYPELKDRVTTLQMDLERQFPEAIEVADLVVTIHYYSRSFARNVLTAMKPGACFYLETPSCSGENYLELPNENELHALLKDSDVLLLRKNACRSAGRAIKSHSFKALIRKPYA